MRTYIKTIGPPILNYFNSCNILDIKKSPKKIIIFVFLLYYDTQVSFITRICNYNSPINLIMDYKTFSKRIKKPQNAFKIQKIVLNAIILIQLQKTYIKNQENIILRKYNNLFLVILMNGRYTIFFNVYNHFVQKVNEIKTCYTILKKYENKSFKTSEITITKLKLSEKKCIHYKFNAP